MIAVAALAGYLWGGLPTADWVAATRGIDLRTTGSGNPGANNARRAGGIRLAVAVLATEAVKGAISIPIGWVIAGPAGAAAAGIGAGMGNVLNPYRRLRGGQALGITAGILVAGAPVVGGAAIAVIAVVVAFTRSAPVATLSALVAALAIAAVDPVAPWGLDGVERLWLTAGVTVVIVPKQVRNLLTPRDHPARRVRG